MLMLTTCWKFNCIMAGSQVRLEEDSAMALSEQSDRKVITPGEIQVTAASRHLFPSLTVTIYQTLLLLVMAA